MLNDKSSQIIDVVTLYVARKKITTKQVGCCISLQGYLFYVHITCMRFGDVKKCSRSIKGNCLYKWYQSWINDRHSHNGNKGSHLECWCGLRGSSNCSGK